MPSTGPARGYIKRIREIWNNIFIRTLKIIMIDSSYHALDIYLITSREEGGPMGLLESAACGACSLNKCDG